jgi:hypothetical protein
MGFSGFSQVIRFGANALRGAAFPQEGCVLKSGRKAKKRAMSSASIRSVFARVPRLCANAFTSAGGTCRATTPLASSVARGRAGCSDLPEALGASGHSHASFDCSLSWRAHQSAYQSSNSASCACANAACAGDSASLGLKCRAYSSAPRSTIRYL